MTVSQLARILKAALTNREIGPDSEVLVENVFLGEANTVVIEGGDVYIIHNNAEGSQKCKQKR